MPKNLRFWRNLALIGVAHAAVITGLVQWSRESKASPAQRVVWISGGGGDATAPARLITPRPALEPSPIPSAETINESARDEPMLLAAKSEIQLPESKPSPASTPRASPKPKTKVPPK